MPQYESVFRMELEAHVGAKVHIQFKKFQKYQNVSLSLRDEVEKKINKLIERRIFGPVNYSE